MMNNHAYFVKMFSGCQYTKDIVMLYFSQIKSYGPRMGAFCRAIEETPGMYAQLKKQGYTDNNEFLSPQLLKVIVEFWGWPDTVELMMNNQNG